jgi:hypothetical protein
VPQRQHLHRAIPFVHRVLQVVADAPQQHAPEPFDPPVRRSLTGMRQVAEERDRGVEIRGECCRRFRPVPKPHLAAVRICRAARGAMRNRTFTAA